MFDDLSDEQMELAMEEFERKRLSIDEMREIFKQQCEKHDYKSRWETEPHRDEETGLYYINRGFAHSAETLYDHLVIEQLFAIRNEVDWKRMTNCYDRRAINRIDHILSHPLVWIDPEEVEKDFVICGKVAAEGHPDWSYMHIMDFHRKLFNDGLIWFAQTLPVADDLIFKGGYHDYPKDMILWDRLLYGGINPSVSGFRQNMSYIAEHCGAARAAEIIELFRADWQDIIVLNLFGFEGMKPEKVEAFRQALFEGMDRNLRIWKTEAAPLAPIPTPSEEPATLNFDDVFSLRYRKTDDYGRLLDFLDNERKTASDGDWARYALAMYEAKIFFNRPKGFNKWLELFGKLFEREVAYQEPNKLRRTTCEKSIEVYLPTW